MSLRVLRNTRAARFAFALACSAVCCAGAELVVVRLPVREGPTHGFPVLRDLNGTKLADGEFTQSTENDRLRIKIVYQFTPNHRVEENTVLRWEGPFAEPKDPVVRVDLLPGEPSGPATPLHKPNNSDARSGTPKSRP